MSPPILWLHEEALRISHPVFTAAGEGTRAIFIWDDAYLRARNYSLKRLVFIYECLCALPVEIVHGDMTAVLQTLAPERVFVPAASAPPLKETIANATARMQVMHVPDIPFVTIAREGAMRRFFPYWNKAEKTAFMPHGGTDA